MKILGIDPGLATVGIGIIELSETRDMHAVDWMTIQTQKGLDLKERLLEINEDLAKIVEEHRPELAVVEKLFFATNQKSALDVAHARGVILATVAKYGISLIEVTPLQLKSCIVGHGKAEKKEVQDMVVRILKLKEVPQPDDAADALGLAIYGALNNGMI